MNRRAFITSLSAVLIAVATPSLFANEGPDYTWTAPPTVLTRNTKFSPSVDVYGTLDVTPTTVRFKVYSGVSVIKSGNGSITLISGNIDGLSAVYTCSELSGISSAGSYVVKALVWYNNADPDTTSPSDTISYTFSVN